MSRLQEARELLAATEDGAAECWAQRNLCQTAASALDLLAAMVAEGDALQNKLNEDSQNFEIECLKAENARLQGADQAVLRLLARVRAADDLAEAFDDWGGHRLGTYASLAAHDRLLAALAAYRATEVNIPND